VRLLDLINELAESLGDYPDDGGPLSFVTWSRTFLSNRVHEARCAIATIYRRREHASVVDVPLSAGGVFDLGVYGARILRVLSLLHHGQEVVRVTEAATSRRDWGALWTARVPAEPAWEPAAFRMSKVSGADTILTVDPPIPTREGYVLRVLLDGVPPTKWDLHDPIDTCAYIGAIRQYVLSTAKGEQVENPAARAASEQHMAHFLRMMGGAKTADAEADREAR
jgi:hypothetical protein